MEAGRMDGRGLDLIDAMVMAGDEQVSDQELEAVEAAAVLPAGLVPACLPPTP